MSIARPVPLFFYIYNVATFEALLRNFRNCISRIYRVTGSTEEIYLASRGELPARTYDPPPPVADTAESSFNLDKSPFRYARPREIRDDNVYPALLPCYRSDRFSKWNNNYTSWFQIYTARNN